MDTSATILLGLDSWSSHSEAEETGGLHWRRMTKARCRQKGHMYATYFFDLLPSDFIEFRLHLFPTPIAYVAL